MQEKRLHEDIVTLDLRSEPTAGTYSSAVLTTTPTETDVLYALSRPDRGRGEVAHVVLSELWAYLIGQDGAIVAMPAEAFQNIRAVGDGGPTTSGPRGGH